MGHLETLHLCFWTLSQGHTPSHAPSLASPSGSIGTDGRL